MTYRPDLLRQLLQKLAASRAGVKPGTKPVGVSQLRWRHQWRHLSWLFYRYREQAHSYREL